MLGHRFSYLPLLSITVLPLASVGCVGFIANDGDDEVGETGDTNDTDDTADTADTSTGDGDGDATTIYEIQEGAANGSFAEGTLVQLSGVVVTSPFVAEDSLVFVEEAAGGPWSGISLYLWDEVAMAVQLQPGDVIDVVGEYTEFFEMSQIVVKSPTDITVSSSGAALPGPDVVAVGEAGQEQWEGVLVRVEDAVVAEANDGFGQYLLEGGLKVGNLFLGQLPQAQMGGSFASITGPMHYSFEEFKLQPTQASDLAGYMGPDAPMDDTSIYDIQNGAVDEDSFIKVEGVIASSGLTWSDDTSASFFVQEPDGGARSGIQVFVADTTGLSIEPGDVVTLVGTYEEYFDMSQVAVADAAAVMITGSGAAPTPAIVDPADIATGGPLGEDYEGVLVRVEDVTVLDDMLGFGEFSVTGDLRVSDSFFAIADWMVPAVGTQFMSITGPLLFSFDNFKIIPRSNGDLVEN